MNISLEANCHLKDPSITRQLSTHAAEKVYSIYLSQRKAEFLISAMWQNAFRKVVMIF